MPGKHRQHLGEAIAGRRQAVEDIETGRAAVEQVEATDLVWPTNDTKEG